MEAIGTLAGGIAHDFNNILGGITGYAELAKMKAPEESEILADLEQLIKSSNLAADLVKQILTESERILFIDDKQVLIEIGIKAFVMKPLVMRNLAETVRKALGD